MSTALLLQALDLVLISLLVGAVYWPRHRRRDLVVAYIGVNVGVLAVASVLASSTVTAGLGLGLFGVLSIIRLRSDELSQGEIAYYFASLALALVAGIAATPVWLSIGFMLLIVAALWYLVITSILMVGQYYIERHFGRGVDSDSPAPVAVAPAAHRQPTASDADDPDGADTQAPGRIELAADRRPGERLPGGDGR